MKIVKVDNYDRDNIPDELVADNIKNASLGELMVNALQIAPGRNYDVWYRLVEDSYVLKVFEP